MKFCYIDESGMGEEPFAVMVGIIADTHRMHVTKGEWQVLLEDLSSILNRKIEEIHTRDLYSGNSPWRDLKGHDRASIIDTLFKWLHLRNHRIVFTVVDKAKYAEQRQLAAWLPDTMSLWQHMALHICLAIQKEHQTEQKNKGHTVVVFDNEDVEAKSFANYIREPHVWTDTYYSRSKGQPHFDQIVDAPYFGDSRHIALIQVADFVSYFLRRYVELNAGVAKEKYLGETSTVTNWVKLAVSKSIRKSATYPSRGRCACSQSFYSLAPASILELF